MQITPEFKATLADSLAPLSVGAGHASLGQARKVVGQAQRLAQVIPEAQPWAAALWAALTAAVQASLLPRKETPPGRLPASGFASAARWFLVLLNGAVLPLRRVATPQPHTTITAEPIGMAFDARPWGWGAVLTKHGVCTSWAKGTWNASTL